MKFAFDSHLHILPLNYICLSSYLSFFEKNKLEESYAFAFSPEYLIKDIFQNKKALLNVLSVMENTPADMLMLLEDDLCGLFCRDTDNIQNPILQANGVQVGNLHYDTLVLTPLIMDFELPNLIPDVYYSRQAVHNVFTQAADTFEGIRLFRLERPDSNILIHPYLGINPQYCSAEQIMSTLETYFGSQSGWSPYGDDIVKAWKTRRQGKPFSKLPQNAFAGIKLYPPLGFDPWSDDSQEREKLSLLYAFCQEKGIPLVTHCDDQGFRTIALKESFVKTSPARWESVLERYPELYVNIAHFGKQYYRGYQYKSIISWQEKILDLIARYPNVYSDLSFDGVDGTIWKSTADMISHMSQSKADVISKKILFGTDFPLCLSKIESVFLYWQYFAQAPICDELKNAWVSANPQCFHFRQR